MIYLDKIFKNYLLFLLNNCYLSIRILNFGKIPLMIIKLNSNPANTHEKSLFPAFAENQHKETDLNTSNDIINNNQTENRVLDIILQDDKPEELPIQSKPLQQQPKQQTKQQKAQRLHQNRIQHQQQIRDLRARLSKQNDNEDILYPSLNVVCSPRVFQQKISNDKIPLSRYKQKIYASNCKRSYEDSVVQTKYLAKFVQDDGMIFNLKDIRSKENQQTYGAIKILICVCIYNESRHALNLTLKGIYDNLDAFINQGYSIGDIAVVIIQDGILKLIDNRENRTFLKGENSAIEFYRDMDYFEEKEKCDLQERIHVILDEIENYKRKDMLDFVKKNADFPPSIQKGVSLLYQNMWHPLKTAAYDSQEQKNMYKLQADRGQLKRLRLFSCFKHINGTKLSSHLWFFQGFCRYIQPTYAVLLDVGTKPDSTGLLNLIEGFTSQDIGGVTGFMNVDRNFQTQQGQQHQVVQPPTRFQQVFFSIQKAQQYQYIVSHFLDKNCQSALGFLHVLPGAWSAYRYKALIKSDRYQPNLLQRSYFKMILNPNLIERDFMEANMYLAEDRILSLGIYCQMGQAYTLKYVPDAIAYTDPMKSHKDLMIQRRRWINSSLFAFLYVFRNYFFYAMDSTHNFYRKFITLNLSMYIAFFSFANTYITPSLFFFILYATVLQLGGYGSVWEHFAKTISFVYAMAFLVSVSGALLGKSWTQKAHLISYILSGLTYLLIILVIYNVIFIYVRIQTGVIDLSNTVIIILVVLLLVNIGSQALLFLSHIPTHGRFVWSLVVDSLSYLTYQGAYSQTMVAHSFCNVDDVSWGTKGSSKAHGQSKYATDKVFFVLNWLFYNALLSAIFVYVDIVIPSRTGTGGGSVLIGIAIYGSALLFLKTVLALYYHFKWIILQRCSHKPKPDESRRQNIDEYWATHEKKWKQANRFNQQFRSIIFRR